MELENINSPLPAREVVLSEEPKEKAEVNENKTEPITVEPRTETMVKISEEPKKNKGKLWFILGGVLIVALGVAGFIFLNKNKTDEVVTLNYWGLWEDASVMNSIIADFEADNPNIKIEYVQKQKDGYRGLLAGRLAKSGTTSDVPDIFRIHDTWIPMFEDYIEAVPTDVISEIGLETDFYEAYQNDIKEGNSWMAIPIMYDGLVMFYNKQLLTNAGVDVPTDWWSLKSAAKAITTRDDNNKIDIAGVALGLTDNVDHWSDVVGLMMKQNGVNTGNISTETNMSKLEDVLTFYTLFKTSDKVWDETLPNSTQYFAAGKLGFYFGPSWRVFDIENLNSGLEFDIAAMPQLPTTSSVSTEEIDANTELTDIHWSSYWVEAVNNQSEYKDEAWKFLEFLSSSETLEKMYQADSQLRSFGQIYPRKSMMTKISTNSLLKPFVENADNASGWYLASDTWDEGLNDQMQEYFSDAIGTVLNNSNKADEAVETLVQGINQLQTRYNLNK